MLLSRTFPKEQNMKRSKRLPRREVEKKLDEAWQEALKEINLVASPAEANKVLKETNLGLNEVVARGLTIGMAFGLRGMGKELARRDQVTTQEQLDKTLGEIKRMANDMPTAIRKAARIISSALPRRGGPGRQPKLKPIQASQACDQIAAFIRRKHKLKEALQEVAKLTPILFGKKVGTRTLQKAWDNRE